MAKSDYEKRSAAEALAAEKVARAAAEKKSFPINTDAALYLTADHMGLGDIKTDEIRFEVDGDQYITQGFVDGILYVKEGDWTNIRKIAWPAKAATPMEAGASSTPSATSSGTSMGGGAPTTTGISTGSSEASSKGAGAGTGSREAPSTGAGTSIGSSGGSSTGTSMGSSGGGLSSSEGGAPAPRQPAQTPPAAPKPQHGGGLGGMLGDLASKIEESIPGHHHDDADKKTG